jgi:cation transport regulator ChaC
MDKILYFAYGSNMLSRRFKHSTRVPSARLVGVGSIQGYRLTFDKRSTSGSGKCDAEATGNLDDRVHGVVYEIPRDEKRRLDRVEALGQGYAEKIVEVSLAGRPVSAIMYYATDKDISLKPYHWYKAHVLAGAQEHGLPDEYIASLERVQSIDDPDAGRTARETAILNGS